MTRVDEVYAIVLEYTLYFELTTEQAGELLLAILKYDILGEKEETIESSLVKALYDDYIRKNPLSLTATRLDKIREN